MPESSSKVRSLNEGPIPALAGQGLAEPRPTDVVTRVAEFAELAATGKNNESTPLQNLFGVTVTVTAELGRVKLSIGEILKVGPGSVLELNRSVSEPVDLVVQGV